MYAVKGGWVGQTFALAKSSESEGRKTRIRRSKEERKAMVEAFITKYQMSNNGNFPSLNLTHKEVGGSFYTVREIVRDIIQENRVLGPGKLILDEEGMDQFMEQGPLSPFATEPQLTITSLEFHNQGTNGVPILVPDEHYTGPEEQVFDGSPLINGSQVCVGENKCDELMHGSPLVNESEEADDNVEASDVTTPVATDVLLKTKKNDEEVGARRGRVSPIATDVIVETFPLRSSTKTAEVNDSMEVQEIKSRDLRPDGERSGVEGNNSGLMDETDFASPLSGSDSDPVEEEAPANAGDPMVESLNGSVLKEGIQHEARGTRDLGVKVTHNDILTSETSERGKVVNASKGIPSENLKDAYSNNTIQESKIKEETKTENKVNGQFSGSSDKEGKPTLDRINLESWEGVSQNPAKQERNPFLAIIKAFVAAIDKLFSIS